MSAFPFPSALRILGALLCLTLPAHAQEPPPSFLLETITVEGAQPAAARIVRAESLLEEGKPYTEPELRQAIYRIQRLPFVLEASFALRKGSERGAYELVIRVEPARRLFFDHAPSLNRFAEPLNLISSAGTDFTFTAPSLIGVRQFVGRSGVLFGALNTGQGVQVGYSHYDLFGRGIIATASYARAALCCTTEIMPYALDPLFTAWEFNEQESLSLGLSAPLGPRHSFQLSFSERHSDFSNRRLILHHPETPDGDVTGFAGNGEGKDRRLKATWIYDTTDHPVLPTRGLALSLGIEAASATMGQIFLQEGQLSIPAYKSETVDFVGTATKHWPVTPRQTISATARAAIGRTRVRDFFAHFIEETSEGTFGYRELTVLGGAAGLQHALELWRSREPGRFGDLRLETAVELMRDSASPDSGLPSNSLEQLEISTGLVFRNAWGRVAFRLSYADVGEVLQ